jgi:hypothetical protein
MANRQDVQDRADAPRLDSLVARVRGEYSEMAHPRDLGPMWARALQAIRISTPSSDPLVTHGARG